MARQSLEPSRDPADYAFAHRLRTRFAETDAMGIIHHAAYLPYLEEARVEYCGAIGHPYDARSRGGDEETRAPGFPVLEVSVQYRKPLRFDDEVDVSLRVGAVTRHHVPDRVPAGRGRRGAGDRGDRARVRRRRAGRPARLPAWVAETGRRPPTQSDVCRSPRWSEGPPSTPAARVRDAETIPANVSVIAFLAAAGSSARATTMPACMIAPRRRCVSGPPSTVRSGPMSAATVSTALMVPKA